LLRVKDCLQTNRQTLPDQMKEEILKLMDIYCDLHDLRKNEISDCYDDQDDLIDDLIYKMEQAMKSLQSYEQNHSASVERECVGA